MKNTVSSNHLRARTQFRSLLVLGLLAGSASAQLPSAPQLPLDACSPPQIDEPPTLPMMTLLPLASSHDCSSLAGTACKTVAGSTSWDLRQHAKWMLGLRIRSQANKTLTLPSSPVMQVQFLQPMDTPDAPVIAAAMGPDMPTVPALFNSQADAKGRSDSERESTKPALVPAAAAMPLVEEAEAEARPIISGPVPALPLEGMSSSLLDVDTSGIDDVSVVAQPPAPGQGRTASLNTSNVASQAGSLIAAIGNAQEARFTLRDGDREDGSVAPSSSQIATIAIHEGFAPPPPSKQKQHFRMSDDEGGSSNDGGTGVQSPIPADRLSVVAVETPKPAVASRTEPTDPPRLLAASGSPASSSKVARDAAKAASSEQRPADSSVEAKANAPMSLTPSVAANPLPPATIVASPQRSLSMSVTSALAVPPKDLPAASVASRNESTAAIVAPPSLASAQPLANPKPVALDPVPLQLPGSLNDGQLTERLPAPAATPQQYSLSDINPMAMTKPIVKAIRPASATAAANSNVGLNRDEEPTTIDGESYAELAKRLQQAVRTKYPDSRIRIHNDEEGLIVEGAAANDSEATKILSFIRKTSLCPVVDRVMATR